MGRQLGMTASDLAARQECIDGPLRMMTYVHCWFGSAVESVEMWRRYGGAGNGVCIETTAERLRLALRQPSHLAVQLHRVTYSNEETPIPVGISYLAACRKRNLPEHVAENEFRLIAQWSPAHWPAGKPIDESPEAVLVQVDFAQLFRAVYLGGRLDPMMAQGIENSANAAAGSRVVRDSVINWPANEGS
jgi:hypothetical protein